LVEQPMKQLEAKDGPWIWRDWLVSPEDTGRWRLQRREGGSGES
jgi:ribonuclease HI